MKIRLLKIKNYTDTLKSLLRSTKNFLELLYQVERFENGLLIKFIPRT